MNKPLFSKPLYLLARLLPPALAAAALAALFLDRTVVFLCLIALWLVLLVPIVLFCRRQVRCQAVEKLYGQRIINVFSGKGQKRLRRKLIDYVYLLDKKAKYRKAADGLEELEKQCTTDSDFAVVQMFLGDAYRGIGNYPEAECFYRDALSHDGEYSMVWTNLGTMLSRQGKHDEAIECQLNAVMFDDDYFIAHNNLASAYFRKGDYEKCIEPCLKSLMLMPKYTSPASTLCLVYCYLGDKEKSDKYYRMVGLLGGSQTNLDIARAKIIQELQAANEAQTENSAETAESAEA